MRLTITGGAGFIGSNLATLAVARGHEITIIDDLSTGDRENLQVEHRFLHASILDRPALDEALADADAVVHLAAIASVPLSIEDPLATNEVNVRGTLEVLDAARHLGVSQVTVASSSAVYGSNSSLPLNESSWLAPLSPYAVSKVATEQYARAYSESYGLPTAAFRFFNVYGPGQPADHVYAAVIPAFLDALVHGRPLTIYGDGLQTRDFVHVRAVCRILLDAVERRADIDRPVNLALGTQTSLLELVGLLEEIAGQSIQVTHQEPREGEIRHSLAGDALLRRLFPALPEIPLRDGLKETLAWHQARMSR
ncbi:NAD-dependent epimerase/dehydratase family protein [Blastococcus sp. Marseille-P5729]|uniref:NAD-dependent epimerase/dehydratase family protein n=1 Tax=Blastococcus sp. Marseille-P5729 TaxID=2086582 RepID=UPI000D10B91F|nr:NAD-dependent epimerase/dehydratase family protein [Blastococcus sp. Marseille-P5729]